MTVRARLAALLVALLTVSCGGGSSTSSTPPGATTQPTGQKPQLSVHVYYLRAEKVASVHRDVPVVYGLGAVATVRSLLTGPTTRERAWGLSTRIPAASRLLGLTISHGTATVNLNAAFESGGSTSMTVRRMQMVFTLTQFSPVQRVMFRVDGKPLGHAVARTDFQSFLPPIFIDSPAIGETVSRQITVHGLANVFEGQFLVEVTNANGKVLVRKRAHAAMGTYADFTTVLRFAVGKPGPGRVTAFDYSAKDGSRIDDYVVPVQLA